MSWLKCDEIYIILFNNWNCGILLFKVIFLSLNDVYFD